MHAKQEALCEFGMSATAPTTTEHPASHIFWRSKPSTIVLSGGFTQVGLPWRLSAIAAAKRNSGDRNIALPVALAKAGGQMPLRPRERHVIERNRGDPDR